MAKLLLLTLLLGISVAEPEHFVELSSNSSETVKEAVSGLIACSGVTNGNIVNAPLSSTPTLDISVNPWDSQILHFVLGFTTTGTPLHCQSGVFRVDIRCTGKPQPKAFVDLSLAYFGSFTSSTSYCVSKDIPVKCKEFEFRVHVDCIVITGITCPANNSLICLTGKYGTSGSGGWGWSDHSSGWKE